MSVIGIIGAGEVGSQIARAAIANGYEVVIANSRAWVSHLHQTRAKLIANLAKARRIILA